MSMKKAWKVILMNSKIDPEDDKKFKCMCKTEKEHKQESEYECRFKGGNGSIR